jgi:ABC-type polysaccharide/polyol phosphate transport system ATPase subunit
MLSITVKDVSVEFPIYSTYMRSLRHQMGLGRIANAMDRFRARKLKVGAEINTGRGGKVVIKALDGINFDVKEGDRFGILGHNGSGKTTLLRTIAGIYEPVSGEVNVVGRMVPLFDLSLGMDPDATGRENIRLRGKILGLSDEQIRDSLDDIAQFTELGDFLYMPIRTYSQGMIVRLAFGISTAIEPEILVLDEMIGAGDASFVERATERLHGFLERAGMLIIASHSMSILRKWCNKGVLLEHGKIVGQGSIEHVIELYEASIATGPQPEQMKLI